jgi:hypothetical protein
MAANSFNRLPARRRGVIRRASLWDAGDFLLSVSGTAFSEQYKRFYYRDIKAIVLQKGPRVGSIGALALLAFLALGLFGLSTFPGGPRVLNWLWAVPIAGAVAILCLNAILGCRVFVFTAVSREELPAIFQRPAARRALPRMLDKIRSAQGSFSDADRLANAADAEAAEPLYSTAAAGPGEQAVVPRDGLYAALIYFLVMLGNAAFAFWYSDIMLTPHSLRWAKIIFSALNALGAGSGVWAFVKVFRIRLVTGLRTAVLTGLGLLAVRAYALYFTFATLEVQRGTLTDTMLGISWRHGFGTFDCGSSTIIAITGLIFLTFAWQDDRQGTSTGGSLSKL